MLSVIGVGELLLRTQEIVGRNFMTLEFYAFAGFSIFSINSVDRAPRQVCQPPLRTSVRAHDTFSPSAASPRTSAPYEVLKGVDLDVHQGEVVSIIGSSGSGKTTLLRCVNLLEDFDGGEILLDGEAHRLRGDGGGRRRLGERELARAAGR